LLAWEHGNIEVQAGDEKGVSSKHWEAGLANFANGWLLLLRRRRRRLLLRLLLLLGTFLTALLSPPLCIIVDLVLM
jgi:hypothetical protein